MNEGAQLLVPMLDARSIAMDAGFTAVEVRGVPGKLPEDRMIDKLTIHFLRPRNGGGEVLRVVYSDQAPHRAFVVFERPEVAARVLQRAHVLQLEGQSFPLTVRPGEHAEVDLPVRATLDLRQFRDQDAALSILRRHGFKVNRQHPGQALLEGTFLSLSAARVRLAELLASEGQSPSSYPEPRPSVHSQGAADQWGLSSNADMSYRLNGAKVDAGSWSPKEAKQSPTSFSSVTPSRVQSPGSAASFLYDSPPGGRPSGRPRDRASFAVDTHALRYAGSFRNDEVQEILQEHGVQMEVQHVDGSGVSTVVLVGRRAPQAEDKLAGLLREAGDALQLVGSSSESYELKQRILGEEGSRPSSRREGVEQERGRQPGRSASLPRRPAREGARDSDPGSAAAGGCDPSKYDQGPGGKGPGEGARGPHPANGPRKERSASESRSKEKEGRATPGQGDNHRAPPAGASTTPEKEQTSKKKNVPALNKHLMPVKEFMAKKFLPKKW
ncbi:hypothetical protein ANANG_G00183110 [Anguilla anguilla]|uniref:PAR14-like first RRM domain-containing protein n=1 Tax=Anguilla anguilla TaxID=7936 RepID=A0A9D3M5M4_ANGAN|nr:hypothetical protein ANANG_G00183110 [Anguilla anguilla]